MFMTPRPGWALIKTATRKISPRRLCRCRSARIADFASVGRGGACLLYTSVAPVPLSEKGRGIVIVASDNYANFVSLRWFLNEVLPLAGDVPVSIYGNIDVGVKNRDRALYEAHRAQFKGRVADLGAVYADAACILLPTVEGHGLSIKAVEALSRDRKSVV